MAKNKFAETTQAVILAAGRSSRFKTKKSKLLSNICGRTMILYPIKELEALDIPMTVILGYQAEKVTEEITKSNVKDVTFAVQQEQKGTGHAVASSRSFWQKDQLLIMNGDMPLVTKEILEKMIFEHETSKATISFCTTMVIDPTGYGRVVEEDGKLEIIEEKDCTAEQKTVNRINAGIYLISRKFLEENIDKITKSPVTGEIYLPELIKMASNKDLTVNPHAVPFDNVRGVNTLQDLWTVEQIKRSEFIKHWMSEGVRFELAQSIHIDINVKIGAGSFIGTGVHLLGDVTIGEECFVGAFSIIENTKIGNNTNIHSHSVIQDSIIGDNVHCGPFARLRKGVELGNDVLIGNFVEMKTVSMGDGTKTKHLTYLGDAEIGKNVNIGAGTITCNFDGVSQNKTTIKDEAFIGSNNTLIAPVSIAEGSYTAGGSTITDDVPKGSLAISRSKQELKDGYAKKLKKKENELNFQGAVKTNVENSNNL